MEALKLMGRGKRPMRQTGVLFFSLFLISSFVPLSPVAHAQAQSAPATPPVQTPEERARILREAQDRINARRQARIQQVIREPMARSLRRISAAAICASNPAR